MIEVKSRESFVQLLEGRLGRTLEPQVRNAFLQVPRHLFVQQYYEQRGNSLTWDLIPASPEQIYRDEALVTQIDKRGMPSSSTSQPSIMAAQLEALAPERGQRVLEIGVGTGYNAALLGKIVGDKGHVISIDIDESFVEQAKLHLAQSHNVMALPGDGFLGEAEYAPYDRILATCGIRFVPRTWFDQLKVDGRLVSNWLTPLSSLFICVDKTNTGELSGRLLDLNATYMEMHDRGDVKPSKQKIDWTQYDMLPFTSIHLPSMKTLLENSSYSLLLQCFLPEMRKRYRSIEDQVYLYLLIQGTAIQVEDDRILIYGDAGVGQTIQQSFDLYHQLGQPRITDYRITFQEQQVVICIDDRQFSLPQFGTN